MLTEARNKPTKVQKAISPNMLWNIVNLMFYFELMASNFAKFAVACILSQFCEWVLVFFCLGSGGFIMSTGSDPRGHIFPWPPFSPFLLILDLQLVTTPAVVGDQKEKAILKYDSLHKEGSECNGALQREMY